MRPTLDAVLAELVPGRVVRLTLMPDQKHALRDRGGQLALTVVRHLLGARRQLCDGRRASSQPFPLTEFAFQAVAARLGSPVAQKRSRVLIRRLRDAGILEDAGEYRQEYRERSPVFTGYCVRLYRLGARVASLVRRSGAAPRRNSPVGSGGSVKRLELPNWWAWGLFGDLHGLPPPGYSQKRLRKMRSDDQKEWLVRTAAARGRRGWTYAPLRP